MNRERRRWWVETIGLVSMVLLMWIWLFEAIGEMAR